jgi:HTH-type transcriptional regulator/antitoxin HigA
MTIGPGDVLKDDIEALGWAQDDLAEVLEMSKNNVHNLLNNKTAITIETARKLAQAFDNTPEFWMNLDTNYRLQISEKTEMDPTANERAILYKFMPIRELVQRGWIQRGNLIESCKAFLKINKITEEVILNKLEVEAALLRSSDIKAFNLTYLKVWLLYCRDHATEIKIKKYSHEKLVELTKRIPELTTQNDGVSTFLKELGKTGVKFMVIRHLSKTYTDGASFWDGDNPVIVYTGRYDRSDNFWFTIAHEIGHILKHTGKKKQYFISDEKWNNYKKENETLENEANVIAGAILRHEEIIQWFTRYRNYISEERVRTCSHELAIGEDIIVGVLQHSGLLPHRNLNKLKRKVKDQIPEEYKRFM